MAFTPISNAVIQYAKDAAGTSASGYYLKFYASGTSTPFSMASASDGSGLLAKCEINSLGYPINGSGDVFIPHVNQDYRIVLYPTSADADANTFANAVFDVDSMQRMVIEVAGGHVTKTELAAAGGGDLVGYSESETIKAALNRVETEITTLETEKISSSKVAAKVDIADENATFETNSAGWTKTNMSVSDGADGTIFKKLAAGTCTASQNVTVPATDFVMHVKAKLSSDSNNVFNFSLGSVVGQKLVITFGYSFVSGAVKAGTVGAIYMGTNIDLLDNVDYIKDEIHIVAHHDTNFDVTNFYQKINSQYVYLGRIAAAWTGDGSLVVSAATETPANAFITYETAMICKPNIIAIGDSICAGANLFDPNPALSKSDVSSQWITYAQPLSNLYNTLIINKGIGGQNSALIDGRIALWVTAHAPRVVCLHVSSNDFGAGFTLAQRTTNIQSSVDKIVAASADCVLLNAVYPNSGSAGHPANADYYRSWVETAGEFDSVTGYKQWVNIMDRLEAANGYLDPALTDADGVHPNTSGYRVLGEHVAENLTSIELDTVSKNLDINGVLTVNGRRVELESASTETPLIESPHGWVMIKYNNTLGDYEIFSDAGDQLFNVVQSVGVGASPDQLQVTVDRVGIMPSAVFNGSGASFFGIGRQFSIVSTAVAGQKKITYILRNATAGFTTPTGADLDGMIWVFSF